MIYDKNKIKKLGVSIPYSILLVRLKWTMMNYLIE